MSKTSTRPVDRRGRAYTPAVGNRLRWLLTLVLGGFALLAATGVYQASVTFLAWWRGIDQQTYFYLLMVAAHVFLGLLLVVPFVAFGLIHLVTSWNRPNRAAIRYGIALLVAGIVILASGFVLLRLDLPMGQLGSLRLEVRDERVRNVGYWLHVLIPLAAIALYVWHRLAGPRIRWGYARAWGSAVAVFIVAMAALHHQDPRSYGVRRSREGASYTFPSSVQLAGSKLIPASTLMMDDYCLKCHADAYKGWYHSSHHNSSFNNEAYLFSVLETRRFGKERDGNTRIARWCAGCHDPVPFFSGEFDDPKWDDPNYDIRGNPTGQAGVTCTVCHAITDVNSTRGNGDYTIAEPEHYPFAQSDNALLQWVNNTLVKAKPEMHKRTFLKPLHKQPEFCSACHKVGLPFALNHYRDFVRGQNHYDSFTQSGVAGGNAKSFYYPPKAKANCNECHMGLLASDDFGAKDFDNSGGRKIHDHLFPAANTGLTTIKGWTDVAERHARYLSDKKARIDIFALRKDGTPDGRLLDPIRPGLPALAPGGRYLIEVVVRTLGLGHPLSQGTVDSNEIWVELAARSGGVEIGHSGGLDEAGQVDPYAHFVNVYMLDRDGNRIDRRNPQDIFVPLYNKQIPPGAGQVVHFELEVPEGAKGPVELEARLNYRKFDRTYMDYIFGKGKGPELPIVKMASDAVTLPLEGGPAVDPQESPIQEAWQRWNDYGIGLLLEGEDKGGQKGELLQAEEAFRKVAELGKADGWVNLARVYIREGRIPDALEVLRKAAEHPEPAAPWTITWLTGQVNDRNGYLDEAIASYRAVLGTKIPERGFDFSKDYDVLAALGSAQFRRSRVESPGTPERLAYLEDSVKTYRQLVALDTESVPAHYGLGLAYADLARAAPGTPAEAASGPVEPPSPEQLIDRAVAVTSSASAEACRKETDQLARELPAFLNGPRLDYSNRLDPLHVIVGRLSDARDASGDTEVRAILARSLAQIHKELHQRFKEDETARGRAQRIARQDNPAADRNAQSIVIHPMHRPASGQPERVPAPNKETDE
ncbi:MAG: multiheme c-type cytochrome [Isosphaeraceae bacterium]